MPAAPRRRRPLGRPVPKSPEVSQRMQRMPSRGTGPEQRLAAELRRRRYAVREHDADLPGRPDLVLPRLRVAIFVHGCFWHGCPRHGTLPKHNRAWWREKIRRNRERDARNVRRLRRLGWSVFEVWEHEDPGTAMWRLGALERRRAAAGVRTAQRG